MAETVLTPEEATALIDRLRQDTVILADRFVLVMDWADKQRGRSWRAEAHPELLAAVERAEAIMVRKPTPP